MVIMYSQCDIPYIKGDIREQKSVFSQSYLGVSSLHFMYGIGSDSCKLIQLIFLKILQKQLNSSRHIHVSTSRHVRS